MDEWRCAVLRDSAALLVSELVSNAILHAHTDIRMSIRMKGGRLRVEVSDGNTRLPGRKRYSATATTGRGLMLVEGLADNWGTMAAPGGKTVWFELAVPDTEPSPRRWSPA